MIIKNVIYLVIILFLPNKTLLFITLNDKIEFKVRIKKRFIITILKLKEIKISRNNLQIRHCKDHKTRLITIKTIFN